MKKRNKKDNPFLRSWKEGKFRLIAMSFWLDRIRDYQRYGIVHAENRHVPLDKLEEELRDLEGMLDDHLRFSRVDIGHGGNNKDIAVISSLYFRNKVGMILFLLRYFPDEVWRMPEMIN